MKTRLSLRVFRGRNKKSVGALVLVLSLGLTSCLPSERQVTSVVADEDERDRNSFFSLDGVGTGLAMNALNMGLEKLGVPSEVLAIFGGGSDNSAVLAALARIEESLRQINQKLDMLIGEVAVLSQDVSNLSTALQKINGEICGTRSEVLRSNLRELQEISLRGWDDLFSRSSGIVSLGLEAIKAAPNRNARADADAALMNRLVGIFDDLNRNDSYVRGQARFNEFLLDSVDGAPGLIAVLQKCTLAEQRYITASTTRTWRSYVQLMIVLQARLLAIKVLGHSVNERVLLQRAADGELTTAQVSFGLSASLDRRIRAALEFVDGASRQLFMVGNDVPNGSFLDTATMKMWTVEDRVGELDKLLTRGVSNEYPVLRWPGENPLPTRRPPRLGVTQIDSSPTDETDRTLWRVPDLYELTAGVPGVAAGTRPAWAADDLPGLLGGGGNASGTVFPAWSQASSVEQPDCRNKCTTPVAYLQSQGVDVDLSGMNQIWTNTSRAAVGLPNRAATNPAIARNRQLFNLTERTKMQHVSGWARHPRSGKSCFEGSQIFRLEEIGWNSRCADETTAWAVVYMPECSRLASGQPLNDYGAEMMMVNMTENSRSQNTVDNGKKFHVRDAGAAVVGLARNGPINTSGNSFLSISCQQSDSDCDWTGACSWSYAVTFASQITTWADDTLLVRNLNPNEAYVFTNPAETSRMFATYQRPALVVGNVATTKGALLQFGVRRPATARDFVEVRCLVNPQVPPAREYTPSGRIGNITWSASPIRYTDEELWAQLPSGSAGNGCTANQIYDVSPGATLAGNRLGEGAHVIYAMARVEVNNGSLYSDLVVSEFDNIKGPPPRPSTPIVNAATPGRVIVSVPRPAADVLVRRYTVVSSTGKSCSYGPDETTCAISVDSAEWGREVTFTGTITTAGGTSVVSEVSEPLLIDHVPAPPEVSISAVGDGFVEVAGRRNTVVSGGRLQRIEVSDSTGTIVCRISGDSGSCRIDNLRNEVGHVFTGVGVNGLGRSAQSTPTSVARPKKRPLVPGPPSVQVGISSAFVTAVPARVDLAAGGSPDSYEFTSVPDGATCTAPADQPSCLVTGLRNNVGYSFSAVAINAGGNSGSSIPSAVATPLPLPGGPTYTVIEGDRSLTFKLSEVAAGSTDESCDGPCGPTESFVVTVLPTLDDGFGWSLRNLPPDDDANPARCTAAITIRTCTITGLVNGATYRIRVRAVNSVGFTNAPIDSDDLAVPFGIVGVPSVVLYPGNSRVTAVVAVPDIDKASNGYRHDSYVEVTLSPGGKKCANNRSGLITPDYIRSVYKGTTAATEPFKAAVCEFDGLTNGTAYSATAVVYSCRSGVQPCERQNDSVRSPESAPVLPVGKPATPRITAVAGDNKVTFRLAESLTAYGADRVVVYSSREIDKWPEWESTGGRSSLPFAACVITRMRPTCEVGPNAIADSARAEFGRPSTEGFELNGRVHSYFAGAENVAGYSAASELVSVEPLGRPWDTWFTVEPGNESLVVTVSGDNNKMPPNPLWAPGSGDRPMQITARIARLGTTCTIDVSKVALTDGDGNWFDVATSDEVTGRWRRFGCAIENLRNDIEYSVEVIAKNDAGQTKSSSVVKATPYESTGVPDTPVIADVNFVRGQFEVSAGRATRGGVPETIQIEAGCSGDCVGFNVDSPLTCSISMASTRCNVVPPAAGSDSYKFRAQARNRDGSSAWSTWTSNFGFPAIPAAPDSPLVTVTQGRANVQIFPGESESAGPADRFVVRLDPVSGGSASRQCSINEIGETLQCSVSIRPDVEYVAVASALNFSGSSSPSEPSVKFVSMTRPSKPTIRSIAAGDRSIAVEMEAGEGGGRPANYVAVARPSGRFCQVVAPATACIIDKLLPDVSYAVEVVAINIAGQSDASNPASIEVPALLAPLPTVLDGGKSATAATSPPTTQAASQPVAGTSTSIGIASSSPSAMPYLPGSSAGRPGSVGIFSASAPTLEIGKPIRVGRIPELVGHRGLGKALIVAKIPKSSRKVCKAVKNMIQGTRAGSCVITLVATNKSVARGRTTTISLTISIVE